MSSTGFLPSWICPENLQNKGSRRHYNVWMISTGTPHFLNLYLRLSVTNLHGKSHFGHLHSFPNSFSSLNNKILIFADKHSRLHQSIWLCSKSKNNQHYTWGWFWVLTLLLLFISHQWWQSLAQGHFSTWESKLWLSIFSLNVLINKRTHRSPRQSFMTVSLQSLPLSCYRKAISHTAHLTHHSDDGKACSAVRP